jgi:hypothetical protein
MGEGLSSEYAMTFEAFEKLHQEEHVPMIVDKLVGKTRFVATKVVARPRMGHRRRSTESPRSISRPWRHCKRVRSPPVVKKPSPMLSKSRVVAPRLFWSRKSKRLFLAAVPCGTG